MNNLRENENFNKFTIEKLVLLIKGLGKHVDDRIGEKKNPYGEVIINTFDVILVNILVFRLNFVYSVLFSFFF
jgi:hypothetical protein